MVLENRLTHFATNKRLNDTVHFWSVGVKFTNEMFKMSSSLWA